MLDFFLGPPTNWLTFTKSVINQSLMDQFISCNLYQIKCVVMVIMCTIIIIDNKKYIYDIINKNIYLNFLPDGI